MAKTISIDQLNKIENLNTVEGRVKYAMNFFTERGYSEAAAAGILGNLIGEGRNLEPTQEQIGGGPGRGILQWTEDARWSALEKWAKGRKLNPLDFKTQIAYIDHELKSYSSRGEIDLKAYKASKDVNQATEMLMSSYVKPGKPRLDKRVEGARSALRIVGSDMANIQPTKLSSGETVAEDNVTPKNDYQKISDKLNAAGGNLGALTKAELDLFAERYSYAYNLFVSNKELLNILRTSIKENWENTKFTAALKNSKWYANNTNNQRLAQAAEASDSASYNDLMLQIGKKLSDTILKYTGNRMSPTDPKILDRAKKLYRDNYNDWSNKLDETVKVEYLTIAKNPQGIIDLGGSLGTYQDAFIKEGRAYGQRISDDMSSTYALQVLKGDITQEDVIDKIRRNAAAMYPGYRDLILGGTTVEDIADTYRNWASTILETPAEAIDITSETGIGKFISDALTYKDEKGNYSAMPIGSFKQKLRSDPKWQTTENARDTYLDFGRKLVNKITGLSA